MAVATLVELFEPFGLNDNLMIPVFSGLALSWGFARLEAFCPSVIETQHLMLAAQRVP